MSKRHAEESTSAAGGPPPIKKIHFEPHLIGPVSTLEEMDIKVLQFQNKKLAQVCDSLLNSRDLLKVCIIFRGLSNGIEQNRSFARG